MSERSRRLVALARGSNNDLDKSAYTILDLDSYMKSENSILCNNDIEIVHSNYLDISQSLPDTHNSEGGTENSILCNNDIEMADSNSLEISQSLPDNNEDGTENSILCNNDIEIVHSNYLDISQSLPDNNENGADNFILWNNINQMPDSTSLNNNTLLPENGEDVTNGETPAGPDIFLEAHNGGVSDLENRLPEDVGNEVTKSSCIKKFDVYKSPYITKNIYKTTVCKFCDGEVVSKHFARHLQRNHTDEREVKEVLGFDKGSSERKKLLALLRNEGNLEPALRGQIIPKKREIGREIVEDDYAICIHCKGYFKRLCLSRHSKKCFANERLSQGKMRSNLLSESIVFTACKKKYGKVLNKLNVTKEIYSKMQADIVTKTAINDILIAHFGEDLLKKNKIKRSLYHISNKLRECGRFLLEIRKHGEYDDMLSTLKPESFDDAVEATKVISRYRSETKTFGAASLALHFGTTLKKLSDLASKLILRKKIPDFREDMEKKLVELKRFKKLVDTQWTTELGSIALKNLTENAAIKPQLLPLTEDIIKLRNHVEECSNKAFEKLTTKKTLEPYKILVESTLVATILHNRKRVGDIQYLDLLSYKDQITNEKSSQNHSELTASLSENEKVLTQHYKRIIAIGKGSRAVTILIPKSLQRYYSMIYRIRESSPDWFSKQNTYFFTYPHSNRWIDGCAAIRRYAKCCGSKNPELLTSSRLRKHIATVTQVLNLKGNELDQLAKFMGHTTRTHEQFYKLPQDVYQVAKVSKILQLMEKGNAAQFKNLSLEEIDVDMENLVEENSMNYLEEEKESTTEPLVEKRSDIPRASGLNQGSCEINGTNYETGSDSTYKVSDSEPSDSDYDEIKRKTTIRTEPITAAPTKRKLRERWTDQQKFLMKKHFMNFIQNRKAPRKDDCEKFIEKHKLFAGVSWLRVKTFIYNVYRFE